jgi:hypothetical protein
MRGNPNPYAIDGSPHLDMDWMEQDAIKARAHGALTPVRTIRDTAKGYGAIGGRRQRERSNPFGITTCSPSASLIVCPRRGTGKYYRPSIKVYPLDGDGDVKPLRVITGDKTLLDWPAAMSFDPDKGDLYIANDVGESILVFANVGDPAVQGDVAPTRIIEGPSTRLRAPTGIAVDRRIKRYGFPIWATPPLRCIPSNTMSRIVLLSIDF